jgi:hypothetical protein
MSELDTDEAIRRSGGPKVIDRSPYKSVRWKGFAQIRAEKVAPPRRQPQMTGTVARAVGEIPS